MTIAWVFIFFNCKVSQDRSNKTSLKIFRPIFILLWISQNYKHPSITKHLFLASLYCSFFSISKTLSGDQHRKKHGAAAAPLGLPLSAPTLQKHSRGLPLLCCRLALRSRCDSALSSSCTTALPTSVLAAWSAHAWDPPHRWWTGANHTMGAQTRRLPSEHAPLP